MNAPVSASASASASAPASTLMCTPAMVYLAISFVALLVSLMQNHQNTTVYSVGHVSSPVQNTAYVFILKIMWFLFWAWILNLLCTKGYKTVAWVLVAIPFLVFFTLMFGLVNALPSGASASPPSSSSASYTVGVAGTTAYNGKASKKLSPNAGGNPGNTGNPGNPGEYVYGNKADKVAFYPNETNTQYSSYASYDANLDNRAKYLDRESKGLVQPPRQ